METLADSKKHIEALESAAKDLEKALDEIAQKYGFDYSEAYNIVQLLFAKQVIKENEICGGGISAGILRDFEFKTRLFLLKHLPPDEDASGIIKNMK
jgi:hypothetical protein